VSRRLGKETNALDRETSGLDRETNGLLSGPFMTIRGPGLATPEAGVTIESVPGRSRHEIERSGTSP